MNQKMTELQNGVKKYLKDLGLDMSKYKGCAKTDTRLIAVIDNSVEFESDCECGGTIYGNGWCNENGEMTSFGYQECDSCGWNQTS